MGITTADIKLTESLRMTDTSDGGGPMTGEVILDGQSNNIFPDISELDRTYGRINLRKVFVAVMTNDTDSYMGSHLIVESRPTDPDIDALLFSTKDWFDTRTEARDIIERYVVAGPKSEYFLYGNQLTGQRSLLFFASVNASLPQVGDVTYLVENESEPEEFSQYCRITDVVSEVKTFYTEECKTFDRLIITVEISDPLRYDFEGLEISCEDDVPSQAVVRDTQVADASQYFGAMPLTEEGTTGDISLKAESVYAALVPSTRAETPIIDQQAGGISAVNVTSGPETFSIVGAAHTGSIPITMGNRAYNYTFNCQPIPGPGILAVEYRALDRWYTIRDDGTGSLTGDGSGTVSYSTGSVIVTLEALPDVGADIMLTWASTIHYTDRAGMLDFEPILVTHTLGTAVEPASLTLSWTEDSVAKTATSATNGNITGDCIGRIVHSTGELYLEFTELPDDATQITADYQSVTTATEILTGLTTSGGIVTFTLADLVKPGTLSLEWVVLAEQTMQGYSTHMGYNHTKGYWVSSRHGNTTIETRNRRTYVAPDDGVGNLVGSRGTIVYATSAVSLTAEMTYMFNRYYNGGWGSYDDRNETLQGGQVIAKYTLDTATPSARTEYIDLPALKVNFIQTVADTMIPGTLRFKIGSTNYSDRAGQGALYLDDGTLAGSIDYGAKLAEVDVRPSGTPQITVTSLVSTFGDWTDQEYRFRTLGSPLQPASLAVAATAMDGTFILVNSDLNGVIDQSNAEGFVNNDMGVVTVRYGELVADDSLTVEEKNEFWYDPADIEDGNIWKPIFVYPNTVKYNTVMYKYIPLDADILGLDPVRLPADGRVPIFRPGNVIVIHNTQDIEVATPTNAQVVDCGRLRLSKLRIVDALGATMALNDYTTDLNAGTVTLDDVAPYTAPLTVSHTVADMVMCSDAQIDGTLTMTRQLTHDYPADTSYVSSALIIGDMFSRYTGLFDQVSWTGAWSDAIIGNPATGTFNEAQYPITVTNDGAIQERWYLQFLNTTEVAIYGENTGGLTLTGDNRWSISGDIAPINPISGVPYFTIPATGWGAGWATGNILRFNTIGSNYPVWVARSIQQSEASSGDDQFCIQVRGDINA